MHHHRSDTLARSCRGRAALWGACLPRKQTMYSAHRTHRVRGITMPYLSIATHCMSGFKIALGMASHIIAPLCACSGCTAWMLVVLGLGGVGGEVEMLEHRWDQGDPKCDAHDHCMSCTTSSLSPPLTSAWCPSANTSQEKVRTRRSTCTWSSSLPLFL